MKIILASKSPRRRKMLKELGIKYTLWNGEADESVSREYKPHTLVKLLAKRKALAAYNDIKTKDTLIISADTVVALNGKILGKPKDDSDARNMLRSMSNTNHSVYSGVAAIYNGRIVCDYQKTDIKFRDITDNEIERYLKTGEHRDKAGSYGIQEKGGYFVEKINGDINNVVGLPVLKLRNMILKEFSIDIFNLEQ
ncbi:MAG: septum formation protein Maf [Ruminococcaceae bacterium]|nr:septum formation protein Maf [Oscillospiraceae bacterium]